MTTYSEFDRMFSDNNFREIDSIPKHYKYYLLRTISRSQILKNFYEKLENYGISDPGNSADRLDEALRSSEVSESIIEDFVRATFAESYEQRKREKQTLIAELRKVQVFNWGGSYQNNLE